MAERNFEMNFEIDMAKIYAKLHLAGQSQVKAPNFVINTGIIKPQDKGDPNKVGDTSFDFSNGVYEVGVCNPTFQYNIPIDVSQNKNITKLEEELKNLDTETTNEKDQKTSITDNKQIEKNNNENEEIKKKYEELLKEYEKSYKNAFVEVKLEEVKDNPKQTIANYKKAIKEENEAREEKKQQNLDIIIKYIIEALNAYMKAFAGEQDFKDIDEKQLNVIQLDLDGKITTPTKFKNINNFQIIGLTEDEISKELLNIQQKTPAKIIKSTVCGKIQFTIESPEK